MARTISGGIWATYARHIPATESVGGMIAGPLHW